ncbi:MAG: CBS domain-containing protein, partial [Candidatus Lokiarchaeota archaeon]|nr:CBS domain-containing protein [Candidatus Lokiarchaeota archaeon]
MESKRVNDFMSSDFNKISENETLRKCLNQLKKQRTPVAIVIDKNDNYVGVIAKRFITRSDYNESSTRVQKLMKKAPVLTKRHKIMYAAKLMLENNIRLLPVMERNKLIAAVSDEDIIHQAVLTEWGKNPISNIETNNPYTCGPDDSIGSVLKLFRSHNISHAPVVSNEELKGIISLRDIQEFLTQPRVRQTQGDRKGEKKRLMKIKVKTIMNSPVITISHNDSLFNAEKKMHDNNIESLIIVDKNSEDIDGIVTKQDFLQPIADLIPKDKLITIQFIPRNVEISDEIKNKMIERFNSFVRKVKEIVIPNREQRANLKVIFKAYGENQKGDQKVNCDMQLFSRLDIFNVSSDGYGLFDIYQAALKEMEKKIKRKIGDI